MELKNIKGVLGTGVRSSKYTINEVGGLLDLITSKVDFALEEKTVYITLYMVDNIGSIDFSKLDINIGELHITMSKPSGLNLIGISPLDSDGNDIVSVTFELIYGKMDFSFGGEKQ